MDQYDKTKKIKYIFFKLFLFLFRHGIRHSYHIASEISTTVILYTEPSRKSITVSPALSWRAQYYK